MASKGFFIIRPFGKKTVLKLKGHFDNDNIQWVVKAMLKTKDFHYRTLELSFHDASVDA